MDYMEMLNKEVRRYRKMTRPSKPLTENEWRYQDGGSAEPSACSFDAIFAAYHDYRNSQQWN